MQEASARDFCARPELHAPAPSAGPSPNGKAGASAGASAASGRPRMGEPGAAGAAPDVDIPDANEGDDASDMEEDTALLQRG